jgi:hypothetical protein
MERYAKWRGNEVVDRHNVGVGAVEGVADDDQGGTWLVVRLGSRARVPIPMDRVNRENDIVKAAYDAKIIERAPRIKSNRVQRGDILRFDFYYGHEIPRSIKPLNIVDLYTKGDIDRDLMIKELANWPYEAVASSAAMVGAETVDLLDDPPVWGQGTIHDLEIAVDRNLLSTDMYDAILQEMRHRQVDASSAGGDDDGEHHSGNDSESSA